MNEIIQYSNLFIPCQRGTNDSRYLHRTLWGEALNLLASTNLFSSSLILAEDQFPSFLIGHGFLSFLMGRSK